MENRLSKTQQKIIKAAENEFIEKGFDGARTVSIAAAAGVTHAMLHYYFRSKEALFENIFVGFLINACDALAQAIDDDDDKDIRMKVVAIVKRHFAFVMENPRLSLFIINEAVTNPTARQAMINTSRLHLAKPLRRFDAALHKAADDGLIARVDGKTLLLDIISLNFLPLTLMSLSQEPDEKERLRENVQIILRRLLP